VTANGATIRPGDLFGTGTISGDESGSQGSLIELTWRGRDPLTLPGGETRTFLQDGDTVIIRGRARRDGIRIGFGEVSGTIRG
jgi:fumarylacetoacetase